MGTKNKKTKTKTATKTAKKMALTKLSLFFGVWKFLPLLLLAPDNICFFSPLKTKLTLYPKVWWWWQIRRIIVAWHLDFLNDKKKHIQVFKSKGFHIQISNVVVVIVFKNSFIFSIMIINPIGSRYNFQVEINFNLNNNNDNDNDDDNEFMNVTVIDDDQQHLENE